MMPSLDLLVMVRNSTCICQKEILSGNLQSVGVILRKGHLSMSKEDDSIILTHYAARSDDSG